MRLRTAFVVLALVGDLALILATIAAFLFYPTADGGIIVGAFCLTTLTISSAILSLHFRDSDDDDDSGVQS